MACAGGAADFNESPLQCAIRETKEEIGLETPDIRLVGVYYAPQKGVFTDSLKFIFHGGTLTKDQILRIRLQTDELETYEFVKPHEALERLSPSLRTCLLPCLEAIKNGTTAYMDEMNQDVAQKKAI